MKTLKEEDKIKIINALQIGYDHTSNYLLEYECYTTFTDKTKINKIKNHLSKINNAIKILTEK